MLVLRLLVTRASTMVVIMLLMLMRKVMLILMLMLPLGGICLVLPDAVNDVRDGDYELNDPTSQSLGRKRKSLADNNHNSNTNSEQTMNFIK
jgi:hypothetical protein